MTVDAFLPLSNFVPFWFVTNKILKDLEYAAIFNDDIVFVNADSDDATFLVMIWVLLT